MFGQDETGSTSSDLLQGRGGRRYRRSLPKMNWTCDEALSEVMASERERDTFR